MVERGGAHALLERSSVYRWFQSGIGRVDTVQRIRDGLLPDLGSGPVAVLDAGCGPGVFLTQHRSVMDRDSISAYVGFDPNPGYIERARAVHPDATFHAGTTESLSTIVRGGFDLAFAGGVLHHVDDDVARHIISFIHERLRPGGRLVTFDGVFVPRQRPIARFLAKVDRGKYVRTEDDYRRIVQSVFGSHTTSLRFTDLLRVPYDHVAVVAIR